MTHNKLKPKKINSHSHFTTQLKNVRLHNDAAFPIHLFLINIEVKCTEHTTNDIYRKLLFSEREALVAYNLLKHS